MRGVGRFFSDVLTEAVNYDIFRGFFLFGEVYFQIYGGKFVLRRYTSKNEYFEYGYPHSNVLFIFTHQNKLAA